MAKVTVTINKRGKVIYNKTSSLENKPVLLAYLYYLLYAIHPLSESYKLSEIKYDDNSLKDYVLFKGGVHDLSNNLTVDLNSDSHLKFIFIYNEE
jgi:hypothetical protein